MAKKKPVAAGRAGLAAGLLENAVKEFGEGNVLTAKELLGSVHGISLSGNLALQYLLGLDIIPLGRAMSLVGGFGSCKSVMSWYFAKRFLEAGGLIVFVDAERKSNPDQFRAIVDNDELFNNFVVTHTVKHLEGLLTVITQSVADYTAMCPDKDIPYMILVDSIAAVTSEDALKAMAKDGVAGNVGFGAAHNARMITEQMRALVPDYIANNPIALVTINHQKESMDQPASSFMPKKKSEPGGVHKDFANTYILEMSKGKTLKNLSEDVVQIHMKTKKSGFSKTGRKMHVYMRTSVSDNRLNVSLDWNTALVELLDSDQFSQPDLKSLIGFKKDGTKASCEAAGFKDLPLEEAGARMHANPEVVKTLQGFLGILRKDTLGDVSIPDVMPDIVSDPEPAEE
jgi:RecA/RadA recombinase